MNDDPGRDAIRDRLAEIWCEAIGADHVEDGTDFFALGGRSLLAFQVSVQAAKAFGVEVSGSDLVVDSSFGSMVERITKAVHSSALSHASLEPAGAGG